MRDRQRRDFDAFVSCRIQEGPRAATGVVQHRLDPMRGKAIADIARQYLDRSHAIGGLRHHAEALGAELGAEGFSVVTQTTYRMTPVKILPRDVCDGFAAHGIEAVLHYSRRSARAFLDAARDEGVEISALAIPQCCLSETVASVLRDAGASQVLGAATPDENALFDTLERALRTRLA